MIGGEYYFQAPEPILSSLKKELTMWFSKLSYFATGRDALFSLFFDLEIRRVWLPNYLCHSVWSTVRQVGKPILYYDVDDSLHGAHDWIADIQPDDAVLVIHFFGVPDLGLLKALREKNVVLVSDVTHLLFNADGLIEVIQGSDFSMASLRKSGPFPDGAFIGSNKHSVPVPDEPARQDFWSLRAAAMLSRGYSARQDFADDENFILLRQAEEILDNSPAGRHGMSFISTGMMTATDISNQRATVAENTAVLAARLEQVCELPACGHGVSQYFVCKFSDRKSRDAVRITLGAKHIYCPIHWDTSFLPQPHALSDELFSIPCDARYGVRDMSRIADELIAAL